ncbi:MAG: NUDIX hydrolase [Bacilli bacterium]|nr:NUDIX hydrolase [Bacilli bacterium]
MKEKLRIIASKYLYCGKIINLRYDDIEIGNNLAAREIVEHPGGAAALAVKQGYIYLVRQYRHPYCDDVLEVPAGKIEKGEDPGQTIIRELQEEVGIFAAKLEPAGLLYPSPGYTDEVIHLFYTEEFSVSAYQRLDPDECLDIALYKAEEVYRMIESGEITDAKTLVLLLKYKKRILGLN